VTPARASRIKDVAERAGVSVGTVSNVINDSGRVSPKTVERVRQAIDDLGYVRNDAARQLRAGRSASIGLVVLDVRNPFFTDVARGAGDAAALHGLRLILADSALSVEREASSIDAFEQMRVYGLLVSPLGNIESRLVELAERGMPTVLVDRRAETGLVSSVSVDDVAGGRIAIEHLADRGARRLAFAGGPDTIRQVADRRAGAEAAARRLGLSVEAISTTELTVDAGRSVGERILDRAPLDRPDGVFAVNDLVALGLIHALVAAGVDVPGDIAVVGYDDIDFAASAIVPLTSVRQPRAALGAAALELLRGRHSPETNAPRAIVFQPELIERHSSSR
jgi:LacI family transcriptional regulator